MVIPLGDERTGRDLTPYVLFGLIAVNALVWLLQLSLGDTFTNGYATVPFEITHGQDLVGAKTVAVGGQSITIPEAPGPSPIYLTLLPRPVEIGGAAGQYVKVQIPRGYDASSCTTGMFASEPQAIQNRVALTTAIAIGARG